MDVRWRAVPARASFTEGAWLRLPRRHPDVGIGRWAPGAGHGGRVATEIG